MELFDSQIFIWVLLPLLIFLARVCDVTIGTIRIIAIGRGRRGLAPILGFFEVLIWLMAIRQIMQNLTNIFYYFAYAGGYAAGTFVGMFIEEKLAMGSLIIRVITKKSATPLVQRLHKAGQGVTTVEAVGVRGKVHIIYTVVKRRDLPAIAELINAYNPKAFYSIEDVRTVQEGIFPGSGGRVYLGHQRHAIRKGK